MNRLIHKILWNLRSKGISMIQGTSWQFECYPSYWKVKGSPTSSHSTHYKRYITATPNPWAGIGHQLANWNAAYVLAGKLNLTFVHQPFDGPWEEFLGFGTDELTIFDLPKSIKRIRLPRFDYDDVDERDIAYKILTKGNYHREVCFQLEQDQDIRPHYLSKANLSTKYFNNRKNRPQSVPFERDKLNVALHIRRGDIVDLKNQDKSNWGLRWLDNSYFLSIATNILEVLQPELIRFHVFSQGKKSSFSDLDVLPNLVWHLNEDVFTTFHQLCTADILVTSPSSFSQKAALINKGVKIAKSPWWHDICDDIDWIKSDKTGNFSLDEFKEAVERLNVPKTVHS